jgi:TolB-like protein
MKSKLITLACAMALLCAAQTLRADVQARLNVVAHALAAAKHIQVQQLAVAGFTDSAGGQRPPFADQLEADLRHALGQVKKWKVVAADGDTSTADALLTGAFQRNGDEVDVHVELQAQPEGTVLWQRDTILDGVDVSVADLPAAPAAAPGPAAGEQAYAAQGSEEQTIPTLPYARRRYGYDDYHVDMSIAYKAFFPTNSTFKGVTGDTINGMSLGFDFDDVFLWDFDFWSVNNIQGVGTANELDYAGMNLALVYPFRLGDGLTLYLGPGGRFGDIEVDDPGFNGNNSAGFGNNALDAVAGAKWTYDYVGLDLRYSYDLVSSYTGYHTLRLGAFYEFGR